MDDGLNVKNELIKELKEENVDSLLKLDLCPKQREMSHKARTFYKYWQRRFIASFPKQRRELLRRCRRGERRRYIRGKRRLSRLRAVGGQGREQGGVGNAPSRSSHPKGRISNREPVRLSKQVWEADWKDCQHLGDLSNGSFSEDAQGKGCWWGRAAEGAKHIPAIRETELTNVSLPQILRRPKQSSSSEEIIEESCRYKPLEAKHPEAGGWMLRTASAPPNHGVDFSLLHRVPLPIRSSDLPTTLLLASQLKMIISSNKIIGIRVFVAQQLLERKMFFILFSTSHLSSFAESLVSSKASSNFMRFHTLHRASQTAQ
ncbi:uncharacterized protein LOC124226726 [Equus quagga]|uniref:uncharacterized protein LOC124226726 n=1 Tax=Equus quagga TaxID=89248 RepID=UPI001EE2B918|nr:uncharacterized protein LOC124226726 [Equus quagga]